MALAGPSRLGAAAALAVRRSHTATSALRSFSCNAALAKPTAQPRHDPTVSSSIPLPSLPQHQRARSKIAEIDSRLEPPMPSHVLRDRYSRQHTYLRISLTEKCNLRCLYCMPEEGVPLTPSSQLLSTSEIERLASLFVSQGVNKIRLTGGEPTVRSDLPQIVSSLSALKQHGLEQIGITTNAIALGRRKLDTLVQNGLTHLNVSLDTLDPFKFEFMTRRRGHGAVLDCIDRALKLGIHSLKINVVVIKGLNDTKDVIDFVRYTKDKPITIRFIEYMPFDGNKWQVQKLVPYRHLVETIRSEFASFERIANRDDPNDTSKHWRVPGHAGSVGFITSMTDHFCGTCNRLRITADGNLKVCLFGNAEVSLRDAMRTGFAPIGTFSQGTNGEPASDEQLLQIIGAAVGRKHAKHAGMKDPTELAKRASKLVPPGNARTRANVGLGLARALTPRRAFHSSVPRARKENKDQDDDQDDPWGSLDKAFEDLQDKSLYRHVYFQHPNSSDDTSASSRAPAAGKNPIEEMEEAIFAQAGAAAVKSGKTAAPRTITKAPLSGVRFSDMPPSSGLPTMAPSAMRGEMGGGSAKWSEYMQATAGDEDDSPWSSLDAFVDNPEASAEFAVPLNLADQHRVMQLSAQTTPARRHPASEQRSGAVDAFAANNALLRQQQQLQSLSSSSEEEAAFAQAGVGAGSDASTSPASGLTHIDADSGRASMVDITQKSATARSATAVGRVYLPCSSAALILATESGRGVSGKGPILHTAQLAGIMAAKRTSELIPLCHPLSLSHVDVMLRICNRFGECVESAQDLVQDDEQHGAGGESWIEVECTAKTAGATGVEMEALAGCMGACLTVWDMVKAVAGKQMRIGDVMVVRKSGGKSGDWVRQF